VAPMRSESAGLHSPIIMLHDHDAAARLNDHISSTANSSPQARIATANPLQVYAGRTIEFFWISFRGGCLVCQTPTSLVFSNIT